MGSLADAKTIEFATNSYNAECVFVFYVVCVVQYHRMMLTHKFTNIIPTNSAEDTPCTRLINNHVKYGPRILVGMTFRGENAKIDDSRRGRSYDPRKVDQNECLSWSDIYANRTRTVWLEDQMKI